MSVFSRTRVEFVKSIFYALGGGLLGFVIASVVGWPVGIRLLLCAVGLLGCGWLFIWGEDMRLEMDADGELAYYVRGQLRQRFDLYECGVTLSARKRGVVTMPDMSILISVPGARRVRIDCAPLGKEQFEALCEHLADFV